MNLGKTKEVVSGAEGEGEVGQNWLGEVQVKVQSQIGYAHKQKTCELAVHFNCIKHEISEISLLLLSKLPARGTQLILIDCYSPEKPTGPQTMHT